VIGRADKGEKSGEKRQQRCKSGKKRQQPAFISSGDILILKRGPVNLKFYGVNFVAPIKVSDVQNASNIAL
jgi:hypothetical protein